MEERCLELGLEVHIQIGTARGHGAGGLCDARQHGLSTARKATPDRHSSGVSKTE